MSQKLKTLKEKLRRAIYLELVEYDNLNTRKEKELEEASSTANIDGGEGPPKTPYAFQSKKQRAQDKKKEDEIATNSTGFIKMNEVTKLEIRALQKVQQGLEKLRKDYTKIYNYGDKTLINKQYDNYYESILGTSKKIGKLIRTLKNKQMLGEGRYHDWRNDESLSPKQKIGRSIREVRDSLNGLSKTIDMSVRLKNELKVDSSDYWKTTHKALGKISERLVKLANKVGKLQ
jgi:hypothetical protein